MAAALVAACIGGGSAADKGSMGALRVYLPREAVVEGEQIVLGAVGIIRGDEAAVKQAAPVALGKFAMAGQQMVINRATILSVLASAGIDTEKVMISGAETITVRRNEDVITSERFLAVAQAFLEEQLKDKPVDGIVAISRPKPWVMQKTTGEVRLIAKEHPYSIPSRPRVWVEVVAGGEVLTGCEVVFSLRYKEQRYTAKEDIAEGDVISKENVAVVTVETSHVPQEQPSPYGMVARRAIRKNSVIREGMVGPKLPPTVIQRRRAVVVKYETPLLLVSSIGEALDEGKPGDMIRVRVNSGKDAKIIVTRVGNDGTVSPVI
jgi:flagella basal body P-ring formation protein FlgA